MMIFGFDDFELDIESLELRRAGSLVKADAIVLRLLACLVRNAGLLVTKDELIDEVWEGRAVADNAITVAMSRLRKALHPKPGQPEIVVNVYGRGYRFQREVTTQAGQLRPFFPAHHVTDSTLPFVGRNRVLGQLRNAQLKAQGGEGRVCLLMGEPGIGKTRVVEMLEREISGSKLHISWGYCREGGDTPPLWPWLQLLSEVHATAWNSSIEKRLGFAASKIQELLRELGAGRPIQHAPFDDKTSHSDGDLQLSHFYAIARMLTLAAEQLPRILVLEDLHKADAASIELLSYIIDEIAHTRILIIATLRTYRGQQKHRPDTHLPLVLGHRNCERIQLNPLKPADVSFYVATCVKDEDDSLGRAVFEKSEGNPFYMIELTRQLRHSEKINLEALSVTDAALDLIRQRIDEIDEDTRKILCIAAVIGRHFDLPLLQSVTAGDTNSLMVCLDKAIVLGIVFAAPDTTTTFAFSHDLVRSVLYNSFSPADKRHWHCRIAQTLEKRLSMGNAILQSELAYHFYSALPECDPRKVVHFCRKAATVSASVFSNPDVVRYTRHAIQALNLMEKPSVRLRLSLLYIIAIYSRGYASDEFVHHIREVFRLSKAHGDDALLIRAACMFNPHPGFKPLAETNAIFKDALDVIDAKKTSLRGVALAALACAAPQCFSSERSEALIEEGSKLVRESGSARALHAALICQLYIQGGPAHHEKARRVFDELEKLARKNPREMAVVPIDLAIYQTISALQRGNRAAMKTSIKRAELHCRYLHHEEFLWHIDRFKALSLIETGTCLEGLSSLEALHLRAERRSILGTAPFCAFDRAVVFPEFEKANEVDKNLLSALAYDASEPPSIWSLKVRALSAMGLGDEARSALSAVPIDALVKLPCDSYYLGTLGHIARASILTQNLDYAEVVYTMLEPYTEWFSGQLSFFSEGSVSQLLGMIAHALRRYELATQHFEEGIYKNDQSGFVLRALEARLQLGLCLLKQDSTNNMNRAIALGLEVQSKAASLGMKRLLKESSVLVHRARSNL